MRLLLRTVLEADITELHGASTLGAAGPSGQPQRQLPDDPPPAPSPWSAPKLRGTDESFASRLLGVGVCRTHAPGVPRHRRFRPGLSVRDVEATLAEALGSEATLSKSTVSRVYEAIKTEFDAWKKRDLADVALEYLFVDGSHDGTRAELCWPPGG